MTKQEAADRLLRATVEGMRRKAEALEREAATRGREQTTAENRRQVIPTEPNDIEYMPDAE